MSLANLNAPIPVLESMDGILLKIIKGRFSKMKIRKKNICLLVNARSKIRLKSSICSQKIWIQSSLEEDAFILLFTEGKSTSSVVDFFWDILLFGFSIDTRMLKSFVCANK